MPDYAKYAIWFTVLAILVMLLSMTFYGEAIAHHAPSGWIYPPECCSGHQDCQMIHPDNVQWTSEGYLVTLKKSEHRHLKRDDQHMFKFVTKQGMANPQIKQSGDNEWHVCIGRYFNKTNNDHVWYCLYTPPGVG